MAKFLNKYQVAELLGMTFHNVKKLIKHPENPMPHYKRKGDKILYNDELVKVPRSVGTDRLVFEENEIISWFKTK